MYPFKKAKLNDCGGDLTGRWYIEFYGWDVQKKKLVRKRFYEVNNFASEQDRRLYANRIIQQLNTLLKEGYHFDVNKVPPDAESEQTLSYTLKDAITHALEIKKHKESQSRKNLAFSEGQITRIKKIIEEKDPQLWLFIQFIYYCFLRPNEIRQLEHRYVHLDDKKIFIPSKINKNGKDRYVSIPDNFYNLLLESEYFNREQQYIFQARGRGEPISKNVMCRMFHELIKDLNLGEDYTLYSWKHSGVVAAYNAGVDIKTIQNQCRHQSLEQTDIYLKSFGLGVSHAVNKIPKL